MSAQNARTSADLVAISKEARDQAIHLGTRWGIAGKYIYELLLVWKPQAGLRRRRSVSSSPMPRLMILLPRAQHPALGVSPARRLRRWASVAIPSSSSSSTGLQQERRRQLWKRALVMTMTMKTTMIRRNQDRVFAARIASQDGACSLGYDGDNHNNNNNDAASEDGQVHQALAPEDRLAALVDGAETALSEPRKSSSASTAGVGQQGKGH